MPDAAEPRSLDATLAAIGKALEDKKRIDTNVPPNGRIYVDSQLPFLCVYRRTDHAPGQ